MENKLKSFFSDLISKLFFKGRNTNQGNAKPRKKKKNKPQKYSKEQCDLYNRLRFGDLVYSYMPLSDEELDKVPEGHQARPYFVVSRAHERVDAYMCSSSPFIYSGEFDTYMLSNYSYDGLTKDTYINLKNKYRLPEENLIRYIGHVKGHDFDEICKRLYKTSKAGFVSWYEGADKYRYALPGDIIKRDGKLYVVVTDNIGCYLRVIRVLSNINTKGSGFYIKAGQKSWKIKHSSETAVFFKKIEDEKIYHTINKGEINKINNYLDKYGGAACIPKGFLFRIGVDNFYLSYGSYNGKTQVYHAYINEEREGCQIVKIDNMSYSIDKKKQEVISDFSNVNYIS